MHVLVQKGMVIVRRLQDAAAEILGVAADSVLVASTGVIGMQVPIDRIKNGVKMMAPKLDGSLEAGTEAAKAIMTTDTKKKEVAVQIEIGGKTVTVGGMCKGSGMIHPNMCTMLGFVTTDAKISKKMLQEALSEDVKDTYNMVSVDGDTSTNDTVLLLANGLAENPEITEKGEDYETFKAALNYINTTLAKKIAGDGEGATALFEVKIIGAESKEQAVTLSKSVVTSSLTKAAIYGHDANWEESCVLWDIPVRSLILRRWICSLRVRLVRSRLLRMVWLWITVKKRQRRFFLRKLSQQSLM